MKMSLNRIVALYLTVWMISVMTFSNFEMINILFLLVSIAAVVLLLAVKRKKLFKVYE